MRKPPLNGDVWIHVDQLQREDGKVWAVQFTDDKGKHRYVCVRAVICSSLMFTQFFGAKGKQPKAVIVVPFGKVRLSDDFACIS